ncbi:MAG: glycosyltransferase family 2 protein [Bacteroidia bacterium]
MNNLQLSIVIPVYNGALTIMDLALKINSELSSKNITYELILVNDNSIDESWDKILEIMKLFPDKITGIDLSQNCGQHNAIICGFHYCKYDVIITMDDDLQHPPEEIDKLLNEYMSNGADVVYGIPIVKQQTKTKMFASFLTKLIEKRKIHNSYSSFRLIKKPIVTALINHPYHFNSLFIDVVIGWHTNFIKFVPVNHHKREKGISNYSVFKLIKLYLDLLINYSAFPLKLITYSGILISIITFLIGIKFVYKKLSSNVPLGYTSIIVSILFGTSIILLCLGIIGQYIYRMYHFQHNKPTYSIRKIIR